MANIKSLRIMSDLRSESMNELYLESGCIKGQTTFEMRLNPSKLPKNMPSKLNIREVTIEDLEAISKIGSEAFSTSYDEELQYNSNNFKDEDTKIYVGMKGSEIIGVISKKITGSRSSIADLAVSSKHRRRGYGREILMKVVSSLDFDYGNYVRLAVVTENDHALNLYKSSGFEVHQTTKIFIYKFQ
jgi:ribosomal protein S18 acetylase RimI-like enzyme